MKYTIMAVDRSGSAWSVCETDEADSALTIVQALRVHTKDMGINYWPEETDDPERGNIETDLEAAQ